MPHVTPEVWNLLEASPPVGEALTARIALPNVTPRLQAALDSDKSRHFLIRLVANEKELHDVTSRGLSVITREMIVVGSPPVRYLDFICRDVHGYPAFDLIGGELAHALARSSQSPSEITAKVLAKWRRFCFWHGCPLHSNVPATNRDFWIKKIDRNRLRDTVVSKTLRKTGWTVLRLWEHGLRKQPGRCVSRVIKILASSANTLEKS